MAGQGRRQRFLRRCLAEIETDKATMEVEAVDEGTVGKIVVPDGTAGVKVNEVIAVLLEDGEDASAIDAPAPTPAAGAKEPAPGGQGSITVRSRPMSGSRPPIRHRRHRVPMARASSPRHLARRIAKQNGIDLAPCQGSGPHGRIVKADVEAAAPGGGRPRKRFFRLRSVASAVPRRRCLACPMMRC
jgi:pyruvate dehydrogenase E2 component (dihydrolipoamide acetyltransferase)